MKPKRRMRLATGRRVRFSVALADAQDWTCPICGGPMDMDAAVSIDHVHPRHGRRALSGLFRNALATHWKCNNRKGNREPTGCELIWLEVVNVKLYRPRHPPPRLQPPPTFAAIWPTEGLTA